MFQTVAIFLSAISLIFFSSISYANQNCVVFLMHGKWGMPDSKFLKVLSDKIETICIINKPEMPWSRNKNYNQTYESLLQELKIKSDSYRKQGVRKVIFAGHSFGANASMAYQAYIGDADALVAIAPGHAPYHMYYTYGAVPGHAAIVDNAKKNIDSGKPETLMKFTDLNTGVKKDFEIRADVLFSYYNPDGLGHMQKTAREFKKPVPFLYIEGERDQIKVGKNYAFDKTPNHTLSKYQTVVADHVMTPEVSSDLVIEWLNKVIK
ncbi:MAG: alpha/beta hydrolase [Pelagibacterales bacterium]|jgi:pimeloyl-ACP methyl ester carboxylesterase|nr:alpha/beta hydrolase [Pelagibacterales bacterium]